MSVFALGKYFSLAKADAMEEISYVWNQAALAVIIGMILFVFLHIWGAIYGNKKTIEGFTLTQMLWYLALAETIMFTTGTDWIEKLGDSVRDGSVSNAMLKPMNFVLREFARLFGRFIVSFVVMGTVAAVLGGIIIGKPDFSLSTLPLTLLTVIGAASLNILVILILGLSALWLEDVSSLYFIYQKMLFIIGGMLVPLEVYPTWLAAPLQYLPTAFVVYNPSVLFVRFDWARFVWTIGGQLVWMVIIGALLAFVYSRCVRRASINGG